MLLQDHERGRDDVGGEQRILQAKLVHGVSPEVSPEPMILHSCETYRIIPAVPGRANQPSPLGRKIGTGESQADKQGRYSSA